MPAVVAGALVSAMGVTGVVATVATAALGTVASMAVQSMSARSGKKASATAVGTTGRQIDLVRSATEARRVVYGQTRVSGPLAFAYTTDSPTGQKNTVLSLVIPVAAHEVAHIGAIYINDERFEAGEGAGGWILPPAGSVYNAGATRNGVNGVHHIQWRVHHGAADQEADSFLTSTVPVWSVQHRLRGIAYVAVRLNWDSTVWAGGLPNLSWEVYGRHVYDPRTGLTDWSDNPALCIRDYLLSPFGLACDPAEIDEESFMAAASLCGELVPVTGGGEQRRYSCNGVFGLDEKPIDIMETLLSCCAGTLVYSQGKYRLYPAAYRQPVQTLDPSMLRGPAVVHPRTALRQKANTVRGTFINPARGWIETDFTPVSAGVTEEDGGEVLAHDLELPFTTDAVTAQRLALLQLQRCRHPLTVELPCTLAALDVAVMEPVRLTLPQLGWTEKVFTPVAWTLTEEAGIDLVLQEDDPALYAWTGGTVLEASAPAVALPGLYPDPPLLSAQEVLNGNALALAVTLQAVDGAFVSRAEVEYRRQPVAGAEEIWQSAGSGANILIPDVEAGATYDVRARSVNVLGLASRWVMVARQVTGTATLPGDVSLFSATVVDSTVYLDWARPAGLVDHYRLRWSPLTSGASWAGATTISASLTNTRTTLPARPGTFLLKAVDVFGRESAQAASVVNTVPDARSSTVVASQTESPSFPGTRTNCVVNVSNQLLIDSLVAFDAQGGNLDSGTGLFDSAGGGTAPDGVYDFANTVDLGAVYAARVTASVRTAALDLVSDCDGVAGSFDAREGLFDGDASSRVDVAIEVSTTPDNPAGTPVWGAWQPLSLGDYRGRGFRFRAVLTSADPMATPVVDELSVSLDLPDRADSGAGVTSSAGGTAITFAKAFKDTPAIAVTGTNLQTGDYVTLTAQSRTGFTVQFKNSGGTGVVRTFDWVARGFGRVQ